ncbi:MULTISPECIES: ImmA/IrrE family metallo-endopeptidase [Bacillales]|jgi:Zn-dependent peptidase ImmA (M78 family)|uniref:ImmA/IrrE family metallo-endopeptidase n=1 Tax=Bacillales TaxID=1385 RepID=UPI0030FB1ABA
MITGKGIIDDFFNKKNPIDKKKILSNICKYTYIYYGIIPFASWFAKDERGVSYEDLLWELFRSANAEETSIGAFLLLAEIKEKYPPVPIGFAQRALTIWCQRDFKDDKVLAYVFNRFPQNRKEWIKILTDYGRFKGDIQLKWGDSSLETILHLCLTMIKGVQTCKIEQIDYFLKPELDRSLNLLTKQIIGLVNNSEEISNHFINELLSAIPNNNLKLTTRMLAFQLLTMKKIKERVEPSHIARVFFSSSVDAPSPLGALLYNTAKEISDLAEDIPIPLKLVARSNRYMNEDYSQIKPEVWKEILHAFHTEIKSNHSIKKLQYPEGFTNDMIVRSLLRETKVQSPIDPFELCDQLNILVKTVELPHNIEAFTIKSESADKGMIVLNCNFRETNRQKFTLAHEIGHLLKHSFPNGTNVLVDERVEELLSNQYTPWNQYVNLQWERDANDFAHRLLLPTGSIEEKQLKRIQSNFVSNISFFSKKWGISMSVLSSRLISVTDIEMILIISENGDIVFCQVSPSWEGETVSLKNCTVPDNSLTYDFIYCEKFSYTSRPGQTNLNIWCKEADDIFLKEEVFATGYGKVYTFLYK